MASLGSALLIYGVLMISLMATSSRASLYDSYGLDYDFYDDSCKDFETIVSREVKKRFKVDPTIAPALIRLHFHDCSVRGCDGSILLEQPGSERESPVSKTLRGFDLIEEIKKAVEKECPEIVSCADILTAAARDATALLKGPFWSNRYGRTDGIHSFKHEADAVPAGYENVTYLIEFFQSKGLNVFDLAILSGAHTVGRCSCETLHERLYNYKGTGKADATIAPKYLDYLKRKCKSPGAYVQFDPTTPHDTFDNAYYSNLDKKMGLLATDQILESDPRTLHLVDTLVTQGNVFESMFAASMVRLSEIVDDDDGEIRLVCSKRNQYRD